MKYQEWITIVLLCVFSYSNAQEKTLGTLLHTEDAFPGYTLFSPRVFSDEVLKKTYLINNCGQLIHQWESDFQLFSTDYLLEDGSLFRSVVNNQSTLILPGNIGRIEHVDWDGNMIWGTTISETDYSFHHDYVVLENGNILLIVAFRMSSEEAIARGRNPNLIAQEDLYEERIWEIEPIGSDNYTIVWEWRTWDHLIQDFDSTKSNFGVVAEHPELLDFNFNIGNGQADWMHSNALSYHPGRDQIILSNRDLNEFFIIDHSTTTEEAAGHTGGNSGMGGDIIYRYGNPQSYDQGTPSDQKLFNMHNVSFIPEGLPNAGQILIFNNGTDIGFSAVQIIDPAYDEILHTYVYNGGAYGPETLEYEYVDPENPQNFFASFLSGCQQLPNGNILINNGPAGFLFEINMEHTTVWEYQNPIGNNGTLVDGQNPNLSTTLFRALKYPANYPAFEGRDLIPGDVIELEPIDTNCTLLAIDDNISKDFTIGPNPAIDKIFISGTSELASYTLYDITGKKIVEGTHRTIDVQGLSSGIYIVHCIDSNHATTVHKIIKK